MQGVFGKLMLSAALALTCGATWAANKTLIYCSEASPSGFDPTRQVTGTDSDATAETMFNRLTEFERGSTQIRPGLAEKWDVSADGLSYTFTLRSGVKFHSTPYFKPTRDFNADDVVFTLQRMVNKNHPFNKAAPVEFPYVNDMGINQNIAAIEKIDEQTVRVKLKKVDAAFLQNLATSFASIHSAEYANQLLKTGKAKQINTHPIGTGPFVFRGYQKGTRIRFDGNKDYWRKDEVLLDKLIFSITTDASRRFQKLKHGECHIMAVPRPADLMSMETNPNIKLLKQAGFNLGWLSYNVEKSPLNQLEVRQALDMAINKPAILAAVYQGAGQLATNPMAPAQWSFNKKLKDAPFDPVKAKALLKKAGIQEGTEITLWAMPVQRPYNPNPQLMAQMIQADWAKVGINAKIISYEWSEYIQRAAAGEHDVLMIGWTGDNGDPDNWLGVNLGCEAINGNNYSRWCNKEFNDLVVKARTINNQAERTKLYEKAQEVFKRELPWTTIAHSTVYKPVSQSVEGFKISPFGLNSFYGVSIK